MRKCLITDIEAVTFSMPESSAFAAASQSQAALPSSVMIGSETLSQKLFGHMKVL